MERAAIAEKYIKQTTTPAIQSVEDYKEFIEYLSIKVQNSLNSLTPISLDEMLEFCRVAGSEVEAFCAMIEDKVFDIRNSLLNTNQGRLFDDR